MDEGGGSVHVLQAAGHVSLLTSFMGQGSDDKGKAGNAIGSKLLEYGSSCWHID